MTKLCAIAAMIVALAVTACAEKPTPHKLLQNAPAENGAPSASTW